MARRVFLRRVVVILLPIGAVAGATFAPSQILAPANSGTTIYVPPETTIPDTTVPTVPDTTIPECVKVVVSTPEPPPTSALVCPWPP